MTSNYDYQMLSVDSLVPFADHPFKPYTEQRLTDMVESIRTNGIMVPVIVRPATDGKYEILSGHNRVTAAQAAGVESIPVVVRKDLTDEDALLIVTETNLMQRAFADLTHSERAIAIATHYNAMKKKSGYRTDLLEEIESLTSAPMATRLSTKDKLGEKYGLSKDTIMRYVRVNGLINELKKRLDNNQIALRVAVSLSYLQKHEQKLIDVQLALGRKINMNQADVLRKKSEQGGLVESYVEMVLKPKSTRLKNKPTSLSRQLLSQYFTEDQSPDAIEDVVAKALELYFSQK